MPMIRNYCSTCRGGGIVANTSRKWWQFWKSVLCVKCGGDGYAKPPGWPDEAEMARWRPPAPPAPPRPEPTQVVVTVRHVYEDE